MIQTFADNDSHFISPQGKKVIWYLWGLKGYVGSIFNNTLNQHLQNTSAFFFFFPNLFHPPFPFFQSPLANPGHDVLKPWYVWGRALPRCLAEREKIGVQTWWLLPCSDLLTSAALQTSEGSACCGAGFRPCQGTSSIRRATVPIAQHPMAGSSHCHAHVMVHAPVESHHTSPQWQVGARTFNTLFSSKTLKSPSKLAFLLWKRPLLVWIN